jgi:AcrR family transcriptional regulator
MAESRRESLIEAAAQLLDQGGPAAVTLRAVGKAAGVSHNAPYKHFDSKEALLAAVAGRELRRPTEGLDAGPFEQLWAGLRLYVAWAVRHPERFSLTVSRWSEENAAFAAAQAEARAEWVRLVFAAQAAGRLPHGDAERLTALLLSSAEGAVNLALTGRLAKNGPGHASPEDLVDDLFVLLSRR